MFAFKDQNNRRLGYIDTNGAVYNANRQLLGYSENGNVLDVRKKAIGRVTEDGEILNANGIRVGYADNTGEIMNIRKEVIAHFEIEAIGKFHVGAAALLANLV